MISIIVGLCYGDEGKGKTAAWLSKDATIAVRAGGGPNAGHTVGTDYVCQIPSAFVHKNIQLCIGRGTVLNVKTVLNEIDKYNVHNRIMIDAGCTIIEDEDIEAEKELVKRIGSVGTGVGPARVKRVLRTAKLAKDIPQLEPYIGDVAKYVLAHKKNNNIVIEGVQGYGLDLLNYEFYPYVTSQSTIASQFAADVGIGPLDIDNVYGVCKIYNSRVADGYIYNEWNEDKKKQYNVDERGTISGRIRRIGDMDIELIHNAIMANSANNIVINCVDKMFPDILNVDKTFSKQIPYDLFDYVMDLLIDIKISRNIGLQNIYLGIGPNHDDVICLYDFINIYQLHIYEWTIANL